jgi:hypothetical protein
MIDWKRRCAASNLRIAASGALLATACGTGVVRQAAARDAKIILGRELRHSIMRITPETARAIAPSLKADAAALP